jgi:hypothetical protein
MCDQCKPRKKRWVHIADSWTDEDKKEMINYLQSENSLALYSIGIGRDK